MLELPAAILDELAAAAYDAYPYEACGLLAGSGTRVERFDPLDHLRAERDAEASGHEIVGVVHSHTHSEPYPSPTDIAQAPDPAWHYVIVGLKRESPETRSYRITDGVAVEERIALA